MRRITRPQLPPRAEGYLTRKQQRIDGGGDAEAIWKSSRQTKTIREGVLGVLRQMAGSRERCMFCEDSRGADIEHFWPRFSYPNKVFSWANMLLACAPCNRQKGIRFDLDSLGCPLLIDPTAEDPWDFLYYDSNTGIITARFDPTTGMPNQRGRHTTDPQVLPINIQTVTEGRLRSQRNLARAVRAYLRRQRRGR